MDSNLFEYLIIIFFVVSALRSLLGKKKKQKAQQQQQASTQTAQQGRIEPEVQKKGADTQDILEQLFGLKIPDQTSSQTRKPVEIKTKVSDTRGYQETSWNPEEEFIDPIHTDSVRQQNHNLKQKNIDSNNLTPNEILELRVKRARESLKRLPDSIEVEEVGQSSNETVKFVKEIKRNISNPESIREYILVSEILNKPKAYRR